MVLRWRARSPTCAPPTTAICSTCGSKPQPVNLAFTGRAIAPHTDNPYREPVPGIQLLHCLQSSADGGDNVSIDGFAAAALVREEDPQAFATLTTTPSHVQVRRRRHVAARQCDRSSPSTLAGDVRAIRWNDRSIQPPSVQPAERRRGLSGAAGLRRDPRSARAAPPPDARTWRLHRLRQHPDPARPHRVRRWQRRRAICRAATPISTGWPRPWRSSNGARMRADQTTCRLDRIERLRLGRRAWPTSAKTSR